jgi:hypothetical protein
VHMELKKGILLAFLLHETTRGGPPKTSDLVEILGGEEMAHQRGAVSRWNAWERVMLHLERLEARGMLQRFPRGGRRAPVNRLPLWISRQGAVEAEAHGHFLEGYFAGSSRRANGPRGAIREAVWEHLGPMWAHWKDVRAQIARRLGASPEGLRANQNFQAMIEQASQEECTA